MRVLTDIGEVGVYCNEKAVILRPSLYAMSELGTPKELVELFALVMSEYVQVPECLQVVYKCTQSDDDLDFIAEVFGYYGEDLQYHPGASDINELLIIARSLLKHGMVGMLPESPNQNTSRKEYTPEFRARDQVAIAMAHLGVSERDAWEMTMTSLVGALHAKFPPIEGKAPEGPPTVQEYDETMAWYDAVERERAKKKGKH